MSKLKNNLQLENYNRTLEEVNLSDDFLFAKTMEDKEVCKSVLEEILQIKIRDVGKPTTQKTFKVDEIAKGIRLDVYVEDEENTVFNIEMQTTNTPNLAKRTRYYQGTIDSTLIQTGADYSELNKTYIIFICTFDPFKRDRCMYTFKNTCQEELDLILNDSSIKIFLNTKGVIDENLSEDLIAFLRYVECSTDEVVKEYNSPLVKNVARRVKKVKENRELRREFMTLEMKLREKLREGETIGEERGRAIGEKQKQLEIVRNSLDILDDETIAKITKVPIEEVRKLRKEIKG